MYLKMIADYFVKIDEGTIIITLSEGEIYPVKLTFFDRESEINMVVVTPDSFSVPVVIPRECGQIIEDERRAVN